MELFHCTKNKYVTNKLLAILCFKLGVMIERHKCFTKMWIYGTKSTHTKCYIPLSYSS